MENITDFDPGPGVFTLGTNGNRSVYVTKLDPNGNLIWAKELAGTYMIPFLIKRDGPSNGANIIVAGLFDGQADFDPGPAVFTLSSSPSGFSQSAFICKLDANGNFIWAKVFGAVNSCYLSVLGLAVDGNTDIIFNGFAAGTSDFDPGPGVFNLVTPGVNLSHPFVCKINANGDLIWAKQFVISGTTTGSCIGLCVDAANNIYSSGSFEGSADFDPGPGTSILNGPGAFLSKLDPDGNFVFVKPLTQATGRSLCFDGNHIILGGNINGPGDLDPGPAVYTVNTAPFDNDIFLEKFDTDGNTMWIRSMTGPDFQVCWNLSLDNIGNIFLSGSFRGAFDADPGAGTTILNASDQEGFAIRFNNGGNFLWAYQTVNLGVFPPRDNRIYSVAPDTWGNIYVAGYFKNSTDFDPTAAVSTLTSITQAPYLVKLSVCFASGSSLNATACDSYTLNAQTYTASGNYVQHLVNGAACDSVITLNLTINHSTGSVVSFTGCNSYTYNGQTYTASGTYTQTLVNSVGCDSVITLTLTINQPTTSILNISQCNSYTLNSQTYTSSGTYVQTLVNDVGCDSIITLNLTINHPTAGNLSASQCNSYTLNSQTYTTSGVYTQTLVNSVGCDSVLTLNLAINAGTVVNIYDTVSVPYNWEGQTYTTSGTYTATFSGAGGCDSIRTLHLVIKNNDCHFSIPNAFTPNGDGINDLWIIPIANTNCFKQVDVYVYNRYGSLVYKQLNYQSNWNGTYRSKPVPDATYYYVVKAISINGDEQVLRGNLTILR